MSEPSILVHDLHKRFGDVVAVDGISGEVRPGTIFGLLGRNGAGKTTTLSGGEQQRLALALALQHDPDIVLLDEPTAGMDAYGRRVLWGEVERLRDEGKTVILTTHYIEEAERLCSEICIVQSGKIVARDNPVALIAAHGGGTMVAIEADGFALTEGLRAQGSWTQREGRLVLSTHSDPAPVVVVIAQAASAQGATLRGLDVRRATLEDAFLNITGEAIDEEAAA